ncbi:hypothetical protein ABT366_12395, partial [Streptomyces lydicus]
GGGAWPRVAAFWGRRPAGGASPATGALHRKPARADRTDRALRSQLGVGLAEFTREWRAYVRKVLSSR